MPQENKLKYLTDAVKLPVFAEHRHNYVITGAFGRTRSVIKIDELVDVVSKQETRLDQQLSKTY
jgi:hypothetical protein